MGTRSNGLSRTRLSSAILAALGTLLLASSGAVAAQDDVVSDDISVRWDNTIKYTAARRLQAPDATLVSNPNNDDGDLNFGKGLVSSRFDLLSELDVVYQKRFGMRVSGAAWHDRMYRRANDNPGYTSNNLGAPNQFPVDTRKIHGQHAEVLDAFVFGRFNVGDAAVSVRAGRHSILWGESLFLGTNAIAGAMMPVDVVKLVSVPGTQFKEAIRPVPMVSGQVQVTPSLALGAYVQTSSSVNRTPAVGSYFSDADPAIDGGQYMLLAPGVAPAVRLADQRARSSGQGGIQLKYQGDEFDFGVYLLQFHNKNPQLVPQLGIVTFTPPGAPFPVTTAMPTAYRMAYHEDIRAFGASVSRTFGDVNVAAEMSIHTNQDLASTQGADASAISPAPPTNNSSMPGYAVGRTAHLNVSMIGNVPATALWREASIAAELAWNRVLRVTKNGQYADPNASRDALEMRVQFEPVYRQALPGVDLSVPVSVGYAAKGSRPLAMNPHTWIPAGGGDVSIGLSAAYREGWRFALNYTHYYGRATTYNVGENNAFGWGQTLKDRDFVSISARYSF